MSDRGPEWCEELRTPHVAARLRRRARRAGVELARRASFLIAWRCIVAAPDALASRQPGDAALRAVLLAALARWEPEQ